MINNPIAVLSSNNTTIYILILIVILELKFKLNLTDKYNKFILNTILIILGSSFIIFHEHIIIGDIFVDLRGVGIGLALLFGGPFIGAITTLAELLLHIGIGGITSIAGSIGLIFDYFLALLVIKIFVNNSNRINFLHVALIGAAVGIGESTSILFSQSPNAGLILFKDNGLNLFLIQFNAMCLFGWLLKIQDDRTRGQKNGSDRTEQLFSAMRTGLSALSTAIHDLSTTGHEQRVADLAVKVGKAMGLDSNRLEELKIAAILHDVGQIQIPREIISAPQKLTPEEFDLVKLHVDAGHKILKDFQLPSSIAEIILQHHEHIDGSGYPNGLKGDELLLESKILHVCDALEAMTSHRQFRRAYSIDQAFNELNRFKETRYHSQSVEICERLFRNEGYAFPAYNQQSTL